MKTVLIRITAIFLLAGCQSPQPESVETHEPVMETKWSEHYEFLVEYPSLSPQEISLITVYLTSLESGKPAAPGKLDLVFKKKDGATSRFRQEKPEKDGIYSLEVHLPSAGEYALEINYDNGNHREFAEIDDIDVGSGRHEHAEHETVGSVILVKELQWKSAFRTEEAGLKLIRSSIPVTGEVVPHQHGFAEVVAPVEGILTVEHNQHMAVPGSRVNRGDLLLVLCPPVTSGNSWTDRQLAYEKARQEFERAERLLAKEAISEREFADIKRTYLIHKSGYEAFLDTSLADPGKNPPGLGPDHLAIHAPIRGTVAEVVARPGQKVNTGDLLMTILDPHIIWLRINLFEKDYFAMGEPKGASVWLPGRKEPVILSRDTWRVLSHGEMYDPESRSIPVLIETENPDGLLKIGQTLKLDLFISEEKEALCVPESAVFSDDLRHQLFVQHGGEQFESRTVETGLRYNGWIEILHGLGPGERIVSEGGYLLKLASSQTSMGGGHPHAH